MSKCIRNDVANWAQVNGPAASKVAIVHAPPWSNRWGHAVAALDYTQEHMDSTGQKSRMFIIGGDDQMQTSVLNEEDLKPYPGGGGYKNDVWWTTGWGKLFNACKKIIVFKKDFCD